MRIPVRRSGTGRELLGIGEAIAVRVLVRASIATYDFGSAVKAAAGEAEPAPEADGDKDVKEGEE